MPMPRKPNYSFERREREKSRALKKADRLRAKHEKSDQRKGEIRNRDNWPDGSTPPPAGLTE